MKDYEKYLKKQNKDSNRHSLEKWNTFNLKAGFEKFYADNGYYPSGPEINKFDYLPSSRQIERGFGGLQKLRKEMNLEHEIKDHNKGSIRSNMASMTHLRADNYEEDYYQYLIKRIPELYVHEHKVIRHNKSKTNSDFFIYYPNSNDCIIIDLFYPMDIINLLKNIKHKEPKYAPMLYKTYFISMNNKIKQELINSRISNRKSSLPKNIEVLNVDNFNLEILPKIESKFREI